MTVINESVANRIVEEVLGESFSEIESLRYGASSSGHQVRFGDYTTPDGERARVAVKPYMGRKAPSNAHREKFMTEKVHERGFLTLDPIAEISLTEGRQSGDFMAVFLTRYVGTDFISGNNLTLEEDPTSEKGHHVAVAVGSAAIELAKMHNMFLTHGDPQLKNYMFRKTGDPEERPLIIDLEKANVHDSKRAPGVWARPSQYIAAVERDLKHLSFSLGTRQFGADEPGHFMDTVLEPYRGALSDEVKATFEFAPLVGRTVENFYRTRDNERIAAGDLVG